MEEVIHGLFFLIQISPHLQRKRRTAQFHGYLCKRGRSLIIRDKSFIEFIYSKLGTRGGYQQKLSVNRIQLITQLKTNMKGQLMSVSDKILLRKRTFI